MALQFNFSDFAETKLKFINNLWAESSSIQLQGSFEHCSDLQIIIPVLWLIIIDADVSTHHISIFLENTSSIDSKQDKNCFKKSN